MTAFVKPLSKGNDAFKSCTLYVYGILVNFPNYYWRGLLMSKCLSCVWIVARDWDELVQLERSRSATLRTRNTRRRARAPQHSRYCDNLKITNLLNWWCSSLGSDRESESRDSGPHPSLWHSQSAPWACRSSTGRCSIGLDWSTCR